MEAGNNIAYHEISENWNLDTNNYLEQGNRLKTEYLGACTSRCHCKLSIEKTHVF